ncbi:hypothetical protein TNCV_1781591 [Trichonephila clavipes]|nr:hypothetical protein TNCV_1781591 [Trichonephila clavipes]
MFCGKCTWPWRDCLLFDLGGAPTPRLATIMVKESRHLIDNRRSLSRKNPVPRPVSKEWDNRTKEEESPGGRERKKSPGSRELEESAKERRTKIGVERKERR